MALNTHHGVLLQNVLPFGISSAPGYFQSIMDSLTCDIPGEAVYLDDVLVSGASADEHLQNLKRLLQCLHEKVLRCRLQKCQFAQAKLEYLGHVLSQNGIEKGSKVNDVLLMPPPHGVFSLRSFLGSVQFCGKCLPPHASTVAEPLHRLTCKGVPWCWESEEDQAFQRLKTLLSSDKVLVHFDPTFPVGISCDASNIGIGAVLFHCFPDGSERPIANVSKTLT